MSILLVAVPNPNGDKRPVIQYNSLYEHTQHHSEYRRRLHSSRGVTGDQSHSSETAVTRRQATETDGELNAIGDKRPAICRENHLFPAGDKRMGDIQPGNRVDHLKF